MRITYDKSADAAMIYFTNIGPGEAVKTYPCNPVEVGGMINLDFNKEGVLLGVEVLDASKKLPKEMLDNAEIIG